MEYQEIFVRSWDAMERRSALGTRGFPVELAEPIRALVQEMRRRGYDRRFRAGMAAHNIVLSRSAEHGLRNDQLNVSIWVNRHFLTGFEDKRMEVYCGPGDRVHFVEESYGLTPRLEAALEDLARAPID